MAMVCPQCNQVFEQEERVCPTCSVHLLFYARMATTSETSIAPPSTDDQWQYTVWGRVLVALILAQGLALGLKQLLTAGFLARGEDVAPALGGTLTGLLLLHSLHAVGLLIGGALAGAGQQRGALYGSLAGLGSGVLFMVLQPHTDRLLPFAAHYAQPLLHMLFGALGGWIGTAIWRPVSLHVAPAAASDSPGPTLLEMRWLHGPIHWGRVCGGATLMACGVLWSHWIMTWMVDASQGALELTTHFQAKLVSWEIAGLTMLTGACLAGSNTWNGSKQGLCVGIGGAILYAGFQFASPSANLENAVAVILCMLGLGLAGGWFGSQLFPPLAARRRRRIVDL